MATFAYKAHLAAARSSTGKQIKKPHPSAPLPEERVSTTYHPPVLARAHAHQFIQSHKDGLNTAAQVNEQLPAADPPAPKRFSSQGSYRARMYLKYNIS